MKRKREGSEHTEPITPSPNKTAKVTGLGRYVMILSSSKIRFYIFADDFPSPGTLAYLCEKSLVIDLSDSIRHGKGFNTEDLIWVPSLYSNIKENPPIPNFVADQIYFSLIFNGSVYVRLKVQGPILTRTEDEIPRTKENETLLLKLKDYWKSVDLVVPYITLTSTIGPHGLHLKTDEEEHGFCIKDKTLKISEIPRPFITEGVIQTSSRRPGQTFCFG